MAGIRSVVQLFIIGYVLGFVCQIDHDLLTLVMVLFIIFNAAYNAHKTSENIPNSFKVSLTSIGIGTVIALLIMVLSGAITWTPSQIDPIIDMSASKSITPVAVV